MTDIQKLDIKLRARKPIAPGIYERVGKNGKKSYQVIVRLKPHPPESETFDRLTDARKWQENTKAAIREGRHFKTSEAKKHTVGELIDRYIRDILPTKKKSEVRQGAQLRWWKRQIGAISLADLSPAIIVEQRDKLARENTYKKTVRSPATVVRYLAAMSHALTIAVKEWRWLDDSPMRKVSKPKEPRGRVRFLSDDERKRLLEACKMDSNPYLYTIVVVALSTAMRANEIMTLRWSNLDFERNRLILEQTKNGDRRMVPIVGHALDLLKELERKRRIDTTLLFPSQKNPQKPMDLRSPWERALKLSGVQDYVFHCNRHSAASSLAMSGATLAEIAEILGHRTLSMVKRYSHLSESHTTSVITRMNEKVFG